VTTPTIHTITSYEEAKDAYRQKDLRQALYDAGEVIMADVLVNLHGDDHRARRRLENRLFTRAIINVYEREFFPSVIASTIAPHVANGYAELVKLGHQMMMNLAAQTAGVDRPLGTPEETFRLYDYLMRFIEGATLAFYTGDRDAKRAEVADKLAAFDAEFVQPSIARRRALIAAGETPPDVLGVLLANNDNLELPNDVIVREIAFYLLAGAHTSATAFTRVTHNILKWLEQHPEDAALITDDRLFVQRCTHETIRLQPSSPTAMRWALADVSLRSGREIPKGDKLVIDLLAVNRDRSVFGDDAEQFNPRRTMAHGVAPWGLSYGSGMHACIGQDLASGVTLGDGESLDEHLFGLVPQAVQAIFDHGARLDPTDPPEMDESTTRPYFGRYPIVFTAAGLTAPA
jgi:cytochrome P450